MAIKILVDSASDIDMKDYTNVTVLPMTITFDDGCQYRDSVDITHEEFYERLIESEALPTTSQITPFVFEENYKALTDEGDTVIVMTMSSKLSGTYQSAVIASEDYEGKVYVIDTLSVAVGERALVDRAVQLIEEGKTAPEIVDIINVEKNTLQIVAVLDTLEYLKKGGRISSAVAFAGGVLAVKPVVGVKDGSVVMYGKARGSKNAGNALVTQINACGGIDFSKPYRVGYTGISDALLKKYIKDSAPFWDKYVDDIPYASIGCAIGTHVGPGAAAAAFFPKHPERLK